MRFARFVADLREFIRIPSVSGDPAHREDVKRCGHWLAQRMLRAGLDTVRIVATRLHPIVYAQWLHAMNAPTLLIYGHYDVQPARETEGWHCPPFAAELRDGFIYGRGASDDKGQLFAHIAAIETTLRRRGALPVNVKCLFEGEEEIGSPNFAPFLSDYREALRADVAVVSDTRMTAAGMPALTCSLRGQLALELEVRGPDHDLHSGSYGGAIQDPLQALCNIIVTLHDSNGRIAIPGFYDAVRPLHLPRQLARMRESDVVRETGAARLWGEKDYSVAERLTIRPSLNVTGIGGGYTGPGPKAVIPARAVAKLSFRLVPDQEPCTIEQVVCHHLRRVLPPTVQMRVRTQLRARPTRIQRGHPAMRAAARAYVHGFRCAPAILYSGGSIPAVSDIQRLLRIPTILMGFASAEDGAHSANEKFRVRTFHSAIRTSSAFLHELARTTRRRAADAELSHAAIV